MTSPSLVRGAARLKVVTADFTPSIHAQRQDNFSRTQREAGIDGFEWGMRLAPMKSYARLICEAASIVIGVVSLWWAFDRMFGG